MSSAPSTRSQTSRTDDELHVQIVILDQILAAEIAVRISSGVESSFLRRVRIFVDLDV